MDGIDPRHRIEVAAAPECRIPSQQTSTIETKMSDVFSPKVQGQTVRKSKSRQLERFENLSLLRDDKEVI
jgi:hypothetical protein